MALLTIFPLLLSDSLEASTLALRRAAREPACGPAGGGKRSITPPPSSSREGGSMEEENSEEIAVTARLMGLTGRINRTGPLCA